MADLLHAMRHLPNLRLTIAGDGPERGRLERLTRDLALSNVEFAGHVVGAELDRLITGSRFTLLPSHAYETLGKTILESYARGRAVVATDLGSRRELVHAGKTGLLYKTGDVNALVAAIQLLSSRPGLADKMGQAGHELVREGHTPGAHYDVLIDLYQRVAARKGISPRESNQNQIPGVDRFEQIGWRRSGRLIRVLFHCTISGWLRSQARAWKSS